MPLLDLSSNLSIKNKTGFSEDRGAKVDSLEVLGESQTLNTNPAKSSPTRRDNREQRDSRDTQRQTSITNRRVADKERQAINIAASRTRAREKEVAKLRQSQTTPLINIFNENPLGFIVNQGQNFFQNTNAKGFIEFKQPKETDFIQDNKSINNDTTFQQSQPQQFLDVRGNKTIEFTEKNKAPTTNENSRLLNLHEKDNFLNNYYGQLKGDGQLGIRRQSGPVSLSVLKQPFIVRDIGNEWGIDTFDPSQINGLNVGAVGELLRAGINGLDQLGGAVLGRQPSVFADKAFSELGRLGSLLLSVKGFAFLEKQRVLKRKNKHLPEASVHRNTKYQGSVYGPISGIYSDEFEGTTSNLIEISKNLKKYDTKSLLSQPGIPYLQFGINGVDAEQTARYLRVQTMERGILPDSIPLNIREIFPLDETKRKYNVTLDSNLNFPSVNLLEAINPVASVVSNLVSTGVNYLKGLRGPSVGLNLTSPFKNLSLPSVPNPFKGFETGGGTNGMIGNPFQKLGDVVKGVGDFVRGIGSVSVNIKSKLPIDSSKSEAYKFDAKAWSEVGQDKVNLIPYGKRYDDFGEIDESDGGKIARYKGKTEEELDFCPFRFEDSNGNFIVFRAILSGITDQFTPEYSSERYIGRPDNVYVYQGTTREISFTFDVYPKSAEELPVLWEKMNYLAGLTYPEWASAAGGGLGMVAPFSKLTIGQMYTNTPGYISSLTYTVQDNGTWETTWAKLPKYIQANCTFVYIGDRLQSSKQKHYEVPWIPEVDYSGGKGKLASGDALSFINERGGLFAQNKQIALNSLTNQAGATAEQNLNIKKRANKILGFG